MTDNRADGGMLCPACVEAMGDYRPDLFPTLAEYEESKARWSGPIWGSVEEATAAWSSGAPYRATLEANTVSRA